MRAIVASPPAPSDLLDGLPVDTLLRQALVSARSIYIRKGTSEAR